MTDAKTEWARCRHWIEAALEYTDGTHAIEDIEAGIAAGTMQFWPGERCAAITECQEFPRKKVLCISFGGGDKNELVAMEPSWKSWAKHLGCSELVIVGRRGWERVFEPLGWKKGPSVITTQVGGN